MTATIYLHETFWHIYSRNFKNYDENSFLNDLRETNFDLSTNDANENYRFITDTFIKIP